MMTLKYVILIFLIQTSVILILIFWKSYAENLIQEMPIRLQLLLPI